MTGRRGFLAKASGAAMVAATTIVDAPNVIAQPAIQWRMSTTWGPSVDVLQGAAQQLAKLVADMSGGQFRIEVFPGGQIMPPFDCFDAAGQGKVEAFMGSSYYWTTKEPALEWFTTIPFGMNPEGMAAWYRQGDGLKLWEEAYAAFGLVPRPGPSGAPQMAGWFRRKINTIGDYKGLKMRIGTGLGAKVYAKAGSATVLTPVSEVFAALERGVINAAELVGPHDDMKLGLHRTARYYYYPGWQEPGSISEFGFNKKAYDALPVHLRRTLDHAAAAVQVYADAEYLAKNAIALDRLKTEFKAKVAILALAVPVLRELKKLAAEVIKEEFQALIAPWDHVAEGAYHRLVAG